MTYIIAILCIFLMVATCSADRAFGLKRPFHPRLAMTPDELAAARANVGKVTEARQQGDALLRIDRTGAYKDYYVPLPEAPYPSPHTGDTWPYWTGLCGNVRSYLEGLSYAWALTGERKYYDAAYTTMMAVCEWPQWTDPDYGDGKLPCLDTHSLIRGVTIAYDYMYDALSEEDRAKIRAAIVEKGCERVYPYMKEGFLATPNSWPNGYAIVYTAMGVGGLAVLGEVEGAERYIEESVRAMFVYFDEQGGLDGGLVEGFGYGSFAVDNFMYLIETTAKVTGESLFDHPYLTQAIYFPAYFVLPGGGSVPAFGDNGDELGCSPTLIDTAHAMVNVEKSSVAAWYLEKAGKATAEEKALAKDPVQLPLARKFRSIRWAALRSDWSSDASLLAFKCGFTAHHNHRDQNHFVLGYGRHWVINDPGYQIYNIDYPPERNMSRELILNQNLYTESTYGHNSILVDGQPQDTSAGELGELYATPALCYTVGDATECYDTLVSKYLRHVISIPGEYYAVLDEVEAKDADRSVEILLHTPPDGEFMVGGEALSIDETTSARHFTIRRATAQVAVDMLGPDELDMTHKVWPDAAKWGHYVTCSNAAKSSDFVNLMVLRAGPERADYRQIDGGVEKGANGSYTLRIGRDIIGIGAGKHGAMLHDGTVAMIGERPAERFALCNGKLLRSGESLLVEADVPVTVGGVVSDGSFVATITTHAATTVAIQTPMHTALAKIGGIEQPMSVSFDEETGLVSMTVQPGEYRLELREL